MTTNEKDKIYYQVVKHLKNGEDSYSAITVVDMSGYNSDVTVTPNPNTGIFKIVLNKASDKLDVKVINLRGENVYSHSYANSFADLDLSKLNKGVYFIHVSDDSDTWVEKIVIE
jgi:hypothetical protein